MKNKFLFTLMIAIVFTGLVSPKNSLAASKSLYVENYSQEGSKWCWVTAGQIVIEYLSGTTYSQCTLYKAGKGVSACSNEAGGFYADMARVLDYGNVHVGYVTTGLPPMYTITEEIDGNSPMLARIGWKSGGSTGHMLILRGYNTDGSYVRFVYPKESDSYTDRTSDYRTMTWSSLKDNSDWELTHTRYQLN
nr:papain-like cysteine protease family protein [Lysinibacillus timonensis]